MSHNLAVVVLAKRNAGKSKTWYTLLGRKVKTGKKLKRIYFNYSEYVEVYVINGSPEERDEDVERLMKDSIGDLKPRIVLCSVQYTEHGLETIDFFQQNEYEVHTQWLNPGYSDAKSYQDYLNFTTKIEEGGGTIEIRNGHDDPESRVEEIQEIIHCWASNAA
jgi:hypothetical protein